MRVQKENIQYLLERNSLQREKSYESEVFVF